MAGDYTRMTFKPRGDHASVLMQQGRVMLDADFNEQVELLDRRLRAEVVDTLARCVTSIETPDAFLITLTAGDLTIGPGRAYVHGILVENHGGPPLEYDPILGELRGTEPLDYADQPYLPNAGAVAPLPQGGTYIVYLDVWEREITYLEDGDLIEKAIAVDTAARLQTAWQVRLLEAPDGTTCDSTVPGWDSLTAPSAGRLTTAAVGVPAPTDPCTIAPAGGYRGTENRLYRIEIHDPGALGTATFKWSRDNASIASHTRTINAAGTMLTVDRLGRDGVKRIGIGDWVEVLDDWRELMGLPGELREVAAIDEVAQSLTLATPLPAGAFDATDPTRHTRVIRWDESGPDVEASGGVITVPAGGLGSPLVLEDGVQISFDTAAGGDFHAGDYWLFAARTADASVEMLVDEPPRGIKHHCCRLAVASFPDTVTDCRKPPPDGGEGAGCDCTVCVTPESHATGTLTIQKAVDLVRVPGGKVCLQPGLYRLRQSVEIQGAGSIHVQGKGWKTIVIGPPRGPAFVVQRSVGVIIDLLTIVTSTAAKPTTTPMGIAILLVNTIGTIIERCVLLQLGQLQVNPPGNGGGGDPPSDPCPPDDLRAAAAGGSLDDLAALFGPRGAGAPLIALDGIVIETLIDQNVLVGTTGVGAVWGALGQNLAALQSMDVGFAPSASAASARYLLTFDLAIEENLFACWLTGVSLEGFSLQMSETRIAANSLLVCLRAAIVTTGLAAPGARIDITRNLARVLGYGIAAGTDDTRVVDNDVGLLRGLGTSSREGSLVSLPAALASAQGASSQGVAARYLALLGGDAIVLVPGLAPTGIVHSQVRGNRAIDVVGNGIAIRTVVRSGLVADNTVEAVGGGGVVMDGKAAADVLSVERNQVLRVGLLQDQQTDVAVGIQLTHAREVAIVGNMVEGVGVAAESALGRIGILTVRCQSTRVSANTVADIGPEGGFLGLSAGIAVIDRFQRVDVLDNAVRRAEAAPPATPAGEWFGIVIGGSDWAAAPALDSFTLVGRTNVYRMLGLLGRVVVFPKGRDSVGVRGNVVEAYGQAPAVLLTTDAPCIFTDNRCLFGGAEGFPVVRLAAGAAVASNNYLDGPPKSLALSMELPTGAPFTVLGNIASGPIEVDGAALPPPWQALNIT